MRKFKVSVNGVSYSVEVQEEGMVVTPAPVAPAAPPAAPAPAAPAPVSAPVAVAAGETPVKAPMPGKITKILAKAGDKVKKGDVLLLLEAMKMQNEIVAPGEGTVKSLHVSSGQGVKAGEVMVVIG
ncbi:MAG: biotin/lipoyl-binding protein [Negativicutes bacterium]|nr:biotin/lipoyl-binding protein [Negativicutes bacterium]